jgi:hypothetical protein
MRHVPALVPAALLAAGLWLCSTLAFRALSGINPGPHQFVEHVTPETVSPIVWAWAAPWIFLAPTLSMLVLPLAYVLVGRVSFGVAARGPRFIVLWSAAVVAGTVASIPWAIGITIATFPPARPAFLFNAVDDLVLKSAYWGLVWGWLPALAALRRAKDATRARRTTIALIAALVVALPVASAPFALAVPADSDEKVAVPEPPVTPPASVSPSGGLPDGGAVEPDWCTPEQSLLLLGEPDAATGHRVLGIRLMNFSEAPCVLDGYPDLAFANAAGSELDVTVTHGGSFLTADPGAQRLEVPAGQYASFAIGWDASTGAEDDRVASLFGAAYPGYPRGSWPVDLDIFEGGEVAVTAWELDPTD